MVIATKKVKAFPGCAVGKPNSKSFHRVPLARLVSSAPKPGTPVGILFGSMSPAVGALDGLLEFRDESEGLHRTLCDYIAGITDRYLMEEHARIVTNGSASA